jgi:hypothetical protein
VFVDVSFPAVAAADIVLSWDLGAYQLTHEFNMLTFFILISPRAIASPRSRQCNLYVLQRGRGNEKMKPIFLV